MSTQNPDNTSGTNPVDDEHVLPPVQRPVPVGVRASLLAGLTLGAVAVATVLGETTTVSVPGAGA